MANACTLAVIDEVGNRTDILPRNDSEFAVTPQSHSFNEFQVQRHLPLTKSKSWSCTRSACEGIPLGSLTAQAAAKPFWGKEMLKERIQEIAEYAALETSSLGSSIEDNISTAELEDLEEGEQDGTPAFNISNDDEEELISSRSTPAVPERHCSPVALRSKSAQLARNRDDKKIVSPSNSFFGDHSHVSRTKSANSRLTSDMKNLSIEGKKLKLSSRNSTKDDGFHEQ